VSVIVRVYTPADLRLNDMSDPLFTVFVGTVKISLTVGAGAGGAVFVHDNINKNNRIDRFFITLFLY
jgi:hypothetical protein